jgi:hypothetical protein
MVPPVQSSNIILVVADSNFANLCKDPTEYITRLRTILGQRQNEVTLMTVSGRYGISGVDASVKVLPIDDKNKTAFGQNLENVASMFDELLALTNTVSDPFISVAKEVLGNAQKTITTFGYQRKQ